ncbi:nuclear transport factor 2 family protein [Psychroserpens sp. MEBiC05023]
MMNKCLLSICFVSILTHSINAQTKQDSLAIKQVALDYIESQHNVKQSQMEGALHPKMIKRTFWKDKSKKEDFLLETSRETMINVAKTYNKNGVGFPKNPKKEVKILDVFDRTASVKLIADDWVDYMHIVKTNDKWTIVNVLWQYKDSSKQQ